MGLEPFPRLPPLAPPTLQPLTVLPVNVRQDDSLVRATLVVMGSGVSRIITPSIHS